MQWPPRVDDFKVEGFTIPNHLDYFLLHLLPSNEVILDRGGGGRFINGEGGFAHAVCIKLYLTHFGECHILYEYLHMPSAY